MTVTLTDDRAVTQLETWQQLEIAVADTGMIDSMPERFWKDLVSYGIESVEQFEDAYAGQYDSAAEFTEQLCDDCGYLSESNLPTWISGCIDWDLVWNSSLSYDYFIVEGKRPGDLRFFSRHF